MLRTNAHDIMITWFFLLSHMGSNRAQVILKQNSLLFYKWAVTAYVRPAVIVSQLHNADKRGRS